METKNENTLENKKVQKIVNGSVKTKKKNGITKFADIFISEDVDNVKTYIFTDILIPAIKKAISDIVTSGIDMILYGDSGRTRKSNIAASKVSYSSYYDNPMRQDRRYNMVSPINKSTYSYDDIIVGNRGEAEAVLNQMDEIISTYGFVKVADLYDLVGITGNYTDNNYGWTDISSGKVIPVRDGYLLKLPRALPID